MRRSKSTFTETARRTQIIACAIDALAEVGYVKTSLAHIAKRADISTSVVSYYFAGKDDLMREVIAEVYRSAALFMDSKIDPDASARQILRAYIESNLAYGFTHAKHLKAVTEIINHWRSEPEKLPAEAPSDEATLRPLEEILRWGQATGEFRSFAVRPIAVTLRKAIDGAFEQFMTDPGMDQDAYAHELLTLFDRATRTDH